MEPRAFGWRQLLGAVNLRDFSEMVAGEVNQVAEAGRLALAAFPHLPAGPLLFLRELLILLLRVSLLVLVVVVFGAGIVVISFVRATITMLRGRDEA